MCGIGGIYKSGQQVTEGELLYQVNSMRHRGPDGQGIWAEGRIGLSHARLSIQDLEPTGHQPLVSGKSSLVFNGEIYNFPELKKNLTSRYQCQFQGTGDAEVLFAGLINEGLEFVKKLNGDFAIIWFDGESSKLHLIRDRLGIKPLYYRNMDSTFRAASEIRGVLPEGEKPERDPFAMNSFYALRYVRGEATAFRGINKVPPATIMTVNGDLTTSFTTFWNPLDSGVSWSLPEFSSLVEDAVKIRLRSKVDVGVLLSGGMDSTLVAKLASEAGDRPLKAFTCSFPLSNDSQLDLKRAREFARDTQIEHFIYTHKSDDYSVPLEAIEEPIGDSIISPLTGLIQSAQGKVKVLLSGEGADEMFAGYGHHYFFNGLWSIPESLRGLLSSTIPFASRVAGPVLHRLYPARLGAEEVERLRQAFSSGDDFAAIYHSVVEVHSLGQRRQILGADAHSLQDETRNIVKDVQGLSDLKKLIYLEMKTWLCSYNLLKLDKITGWFGMEGRAPYLDHRLVEMVFAAPDDVLIGFFERKPLVRDLCKSHGIAQPAKIPFTYQSERGENPSVGFLQSKRTDLSGIQSAWASRWGVS